MTFIQLSLEDLQQYLLLTNWIVSSEGSAGQIWTKEDSSGELHSIPVPNRPAPDTIKWRSAVNQISKFEMKTFDQVLFRIKYPSVDVAKIRGANDTFVDNTIPLKSGVGLVGSTYKMLRAIATTSRRPRGHIAGNFSKIGDEIVNSARLGQTEVGSYIFPVLVQVSQISHLPTVGPFQNENLGLQNVQYEPIERRMTRTFAQALQALSANIVEPAREPRLNQMGNLITAGVSREFVLALNEILEGGRISNFDASFEWAPSVMASPDTPTVVSIPSGAQELLARTSQLLKESRVDTNQIFSGRIVEVGWDIDDPFGVIGVQTFRNSRAAVVEARLTAEQMHQALNWMNAGRAVVVSGHVDQDPGKRAKIIVPRRFNALDEEFLQ